MRTLRGISNSRSTYPSHGPDGVRQTASGLRDARIGGAPQRDGALEAESCKGAADEGHESNERRTEGFRPPAK